MKYIIKLLDNLMSIFIYGVIFMVLLLYADSSLSGKQIVSYSLILGFFAGLINNIERVLRELFDKNNKDK